MDSIKADSISDLFNKIKTYYVNMNIRNQHKEQSIVAQLFHC